MNQQDLERIALRLASRKLGGPIGTGQKDELEKLKKALEEAQAERERLLARATGGSRQQQEYNITTIGKVVQDRIKLEKKEKSNLEYIKRARGAEEDDEKSSVQQVKQHEDQALKRARVLKLNERITSFRLAGVSCFSIGGRPADLGLRFDATWGGHYFDEKYYVILTGAALTLHRHSIPYFIPLDEISKAFLPLDPSQFCRRVSRYVCAYAGRRVLAEQLGRDFFGKATVETSASIDVVTLTGRLKAKGDTPVHSVQLKFDSVLDLIPSRADVSFLRTNGEIVLQRLILDRIPGDINSARFFSYSTWIHSVLDKQFAKTNDAIEEVQEEDEEEENIEEQKEEPDDEDRSE